MSITLTREALTCTRPDLSTIVRVYNGAPHVTFLDTDGHEIGSWQPLTGVVLWHTMDGDAPMAETASTADEAAEILRPQVTADDLVHLPVDVTLCMGLTKALGQCQRKPMTSAGVNVHFCHAHQAQAPQVKASKKASRKTPVQATARTASTTTKESTMTTTPKVTLTSTNARIDALASEMAGARTDLAEIKALLGAKAPAKARTTKAPAKKAPKAKAATKAKAPVAKPATKGARAVAGGSGLSRSAWNKTLTTKARLAGKKGGVSVYSLVIANWSLVQTQRLAGLTPDDVLSSF